ncbi:rho GTPase-activating protein 12 isoform X2 [Tetranychus urticae]|uniref:rho GTPase-activating protein 12 isoform X2 n=1 Tax=Tetranychus urticae TaxID=32264 RepID=UPI000D652003|nr:rho GTPase-activating protein 12 isoform X2 [Tetranychus urticae]
MPKDNEICLDHFEDLIDDSSPLKSLIDRRIVPSNDKRVKIVGTKRPDVRNFFNHLNELTQGDQENGRSDKTNTKTVENGINNKESSSADDKEDKGSPVMTNYHKNNINNNNIIYNNEINIGAFKVADTVKTGNLSSSSSSSSSSINQVNATGNNGGAIGVIDCSPSSLRDSITDISINPSLNKLDKRLIESDGGFKFIKWTANHRGYKINPSNKRNTWFSDSTRQDDESATIVSLKIKSTDPLIGDSYHHFVNQNAIKPTKQDYKLSSSLGLGEQFVRARSNSSPEAKEPVLVNNSPNDKLGNELKSSKVSNDNDNHHKEPIETTSEKKRIGEIIRNLLRRRPTLDEIRAKGILIDGPIFGCDLTSLCNREGQFVPKILQYCIEAIEAKGLQTDGLYRICGNLSEVQKIRFQINNGNYDVIWSQENVHALTGVLKLFLRDLKEPLFPFDLFNSFIFTTGIPNKKDQIETLQKLVNQLPKCNYHTLLFLLKHLLRVVQYKDKNRMQIQNLSIIFGPTLMWPRIESNDFSYY